MTFLITLLVLVPMGGGPYPFFRVHHQSKAATVIWMVVLTGVIAAISIGIGAMTI